MTQRCLIAALLLIASMGATHAQNATQGQESPAVVKAVAPHYPPIAKAAWQEGQVLVEVHINKEGKVTSAKIIGKQHGTQLLYRVSENAALLWQFAPSQDNLNERVAQLTFIFRLVPDQEIRTSFLPPYQIEIAEAEIRPLTAKVMVELQLQADSRLRLPRPTQ